MNVPLPKSPREGMEWHPDREEWLDPEWSDGFDKPDPADEVPRIDDNVVYEARKSREKAQRAAEILNSPIFREIIQEIRDEIFNDFARANAIEPDQLVLQKLRVQSLEHVLTKLHSKAQVGAKALATINAYEEQKRAAG